MLVGDGPPIRFVATSENSVLAREFAISLPKASLAGKKNRVSTQEL